MEVDRGPDRYRSGLHLALRLSRERQKTARESSVHVRTPGAVDVRRARAPARLVHRPSVAPRFLTVLVGMGLRPSQVVIHEVRDVPGRRQDDRCRVGGQGEPARERADGTTAGSGEVQTDLPGFR